MKGLYDFCEKESFYFIGDVCGGWLRESFVWFEGNYL